jgi:hypothetical protein
MNPLRRLAKIVMLGFVLLLSAGCNFSAPSTPSSPTPGLLVVAVLNTDGVPQAGLPVYAFDGTTYTNDSKVTDASGQVAFTLPQGSYRFRADLNGTRFWSGSRNHCTIPGCSSVTVTTTVPVTVTVIDASNTPQANVPVYVFDGKTYAGYSQSTNSAGLVVFTLPQGSYRFRVDKGGSQYWSGATNDCPVPGCGNATVTLPAKGSLRRDVPFTLTSSQPRADTTPLFG